MGHGVSKHQVGWASGLLCVGAGTDNTKDSLLKGTRMWSRQLLPILFPVGCWALEEPCARAFDRGEKTSVGAVGF